MRDTEILVTHHKALMELSHNASFIELPRPRKLAALVELCTRLLGLKRASVWLFPPERDRIRCEWLHDEEQPDRNSCISQKDSEFNLFRSDHPEYFRAISEERVVAVNDARNDIRTRSFDRDYLSVQNIHSMLDAPIFDGEHLSGVVCLESDVRRDWSVPDISLAAAIADTISLMNTHEAWLRSKRALEYVRHYDSLTGLANMESLRDRLGHLVRKITRRNTGSLVLLWIDVDRLKTINDGLGPQAGDDVIAEIGQRLKEMQLAGKDLLARIGGDEFALVIRNYTLPDFLDEAIQDIQHRIRQPIRVSGQNLNVSTSIGVCHFPGDCQEPEELLRGAEAAMYHAKRQGRDRSTLFDSEIQMTARSRFALENELREVLKVDGLDVFYQPIMDRTGTQLESMEALVRWQHPERGWLSPIEFLDIARGAGLMYELGACVLKRVCAHWRDAKDRNILLPTMSVNLSSEQVLMPELPELVQQICHHQSMPVSALQFEVTEDSIQGDFSIISRILEQLVEAGAELAIDDFGTGYSSLSRLKSLPFSRIKIDRSFINNLPDDENDCAITLSIIGLARGLGLSVVAEGVENDAHEAWLFDKGCDYLQGYRYSKPLPYPEFLSCYFSD
ncbi:sensor domain-containing phosphodiesterase [Marinobacter sp. F3R08]|uniref:sensor domain-containing phosphodiesterase n=1 Tax=Marinobacter sp. F3R08 TaxID=2841559 RepID=UPI001C09E7C4|nr:sensor domain-containing phosphodiesterase [Marinobacter sp. F3R08]MBU2954310.1 sensor domain-containing phosphodiesterase [Marinobacter sp. F3R08]